jgi:hypothetical protein
MNIHPLAQEISDYLYGWQVVVKYEHNAYLTGPDRREIHLRLEGDRLIVSGCYPHFDHPHYGEAVIGGNDEPPRITLNPNRKPVALAREIMRRFIPKYEPLYQLALQRVAQRAAHQRAIASHIIQLTAILGQPADIAGNKTYINQPNPCNDSVLYGGFKINSANSITVKLNGLSLAQAVKIARVLAENDDQSLEKPI